MLVCLSLDKVSLVVNIQRRLRMSNTLSNHNIYTIGLAGNIGKLIKERPVPTIELNLIPNCFETGIMTELLTAWISVLM